MKEIYEDLFVYFAFMILGIILGVCASNLYSIYYVDEGEQKQSFSNINITDISENATLQDIIMRETSNFTIINGSCKDYAEYFNKTFSEKYKELDVRWERWMCLDDVRNCTNAHSYLMIGGRNSLCMLNSKRYDCVDFEK